MIAKILTAARPGFNSTLITAEVDILEGLPNLTIVGLPDHAVKESRDRIRSAITNSGFFFPAKQIVINLSPNDTPKEGGLIEAAMAVAVLVASGQVTPEAFKNTAVLGALSLDGTFTPARGLAAAAIFAASQPGIRQLIVPRQDSNAISAPPDVKVFTLSDLADISAYALQGIEARTGHLYEPEAEVAEINFEQIFGLGLAKRALAVAAVGRHHLLMVGSAGSGKSLLARAYRHILPPLTFDEAAEVTHIHSLAGQIDGDLVRRRPFRIPHHTASVPALVGGGSNAQPGEISLAHHGTLFLDELSLFRNDALQGLREPLEEKHVTIARSRGHITYPADFQLVAAANPCRCGNLFKKDAKCLCGPKYGHHAFLKIVGPFLDRIGIEVNLDNLPDWPVEESYTTFNLAQKVAMARERSRNDNAGRLNNEADVATLYKLFSDLNLAKLYAEYASQERISMRAWIMTLRVAKSIADFDGVKPGIVPLREAMNYRFIRSRMESLLLVA